MINKEEIKKLATKEELKAEQDKIVKLQTYDLSHMTYLIKYVFQMKQKI